MHDPHELTPRLQAFAKQVPIESFLQKLNAALATADLSFPGGDISIASALPLVYIVGAPRSGTTLLYQLLGRFARVGYINNLTARFWGRPSVGIALTRALYGETSHEGIDFSSSFGVTQDPRGPHEFGYFWRHWLALDVSPTHHLSRQALSELDDEGLRTALQKEILAVFGLPVVMKNVICGFHASYLTQIHPPSLFVHIVRDPFATAVSILHARKQRYGDYGVWWSLKPSTWPFVDVQGDSGAEVAIQVLECRREFKEQLAEPGVNGLTVTYEDLCAHPGEVLSAILSCLKEYGWPVTLRSHDFPTLTRAVPRPLPSELVASVRRILAQEIV